MAYEVVVPRLGLTMEEGRVVEWYKADGETVEAGEPLLAVETDKVVLDVEAAVSGTVFHGPDIPPDPLPIGTVIGYILDPGEAAPNGALSLAPRADARAGPKSMASPVRAPSAEVADRKLSSPAARRLAKELSIDWRQVERPGGSPVLAEHVEAARLLARTETRVLASPVARRLAESAGIDLADVAARTPSKRLSRADVEAAIDGLTPPPAVSEAPVARANGHATPMTQLRRVIFDRMAQSAHTTAAVPLVTEADATELVILREKLKATLGERGLPVPGYTDLIIKLTAVALQDHPKLNAHLRGDELVVMETIDIGIAVDTEAGLLVPVLRDVASRSTQNLVIESKRLVERARARALQPDDLTGGTFTVTSLGMFGIDAFSPIINLPEIAILGVGRIISKPAVLNGEVVPWEMMTLSLTFDHRAVDGAPAARFLNTIREFVEEPHLWLTR